RRRAEAARLEQLRHVRQREEGRRRNGSEARRRDQDRLAGRRAHGRRGGRMKRRRGELNIFSMSFLDAITAGFGCVVLLFMLVSANALIESRTVVEDREAE